ncbi:MAG: lipoate--protein ligase family protein [Solirubrobacterales bacterium]
MRLDLIRTSFPEDPAAGPALARLLLEQVATGQRGPTLRIARTGRAVAFGRRDSVSPGYREAVTIAAEMGYPGIERISGGRATAYVGDTLVLGLTLPDREPARRTGQRFDLVAGIILSALGRLGLDASVGRLPREYCPGDHSIILDSEIKVAGLGQRMVSRAAHVGVVMTVSGATELREVLVPVYGALGLDLDPATAGALSDGTEGPALEEVVQALVTAFGHETDLDEVELDPGTSAAARDSAAGFSSLPTVPRAPETDGGD